jgi:hypothetical protein
MGKNGGALMPISREPNMYNEIERFKDEINNHFGDEIKVKKRIHELE